MSTTLQVDPTGIVETCPHCGQKNRVQFSRLGLTVRCGRCKNELPPLDSPIEIDDERLFTSLVETARLPLLVDFWAGWCGPCKVMAPEVAHVAADNSSKFLVAKVNTEALPILAQQHGISALPTLVLFVGGFEVGRLSGARPAAQILRFVSQKIRSE